MVIYVIFGVIGLVFAIISAMGSLAMIKTHKLLKEIVDSGAIPSMVLFKLKKEAREMVSAGYAYNPAVAEDLQRALQAFPKDKEAQELVQQVGNLIKPLQPS